MTQPKASKLTSRTKPPAKQKKKPVETFFISHDPLTGEPL